MRKLTDVQRTGALGRGKGGCTKGSRDGQKNPTNGYEDRKLETWGKADLVRDPGIGIDTVGGGGVGGGGGGVLVVETKFKKRNYPEIIMEVS